MGFPCHGTNLFAESALEMVGVADTSSRSIGLRRDVFSLEFSSGTRGRMVYIAYENAHEHRLAKISFDELGLT